MANMDPEIVGILPCVVFGVQSINDQVPLFHLMTEEGAVWWKMPIHGLCWKADAPETPLDELVLWNNFSSYVSVTAFSFLKSMRMKYKNRSGKECWGSYLFTLDWGHEDGTIPDLKFSESPTQHKCGHVIKLDDGNFAIQPNNRVIFYDPSFAVKTGQVLMQRRSTDVLWNVEQTSKWRTEDNENFHYEMVKIEQNSPEEE